MLDADPLARPSLLRFLRKMRSNRSAAGRHLKRIVDFLGCPVFFITKSERNSEFVTHEQTDLIEL